ncbi:hypothetical protein ACOMHN_039006 [Nucella lapillus]
MEAVPLEMDDIFDERLQEEDTEQVPQMLPDLPDAEEAENDGQGNEDDTENKKVLDKLKGMKGASKDTVKRPIPKLDSTRLIGERGIPILPRVFKDVKLKGKGHEVDDLRVVMRYLEHWGHRLFPKMPFDEVVERVERLGAKRDVQTCIKKMRMDMPVLGSDMVRRGDDEEDGEEEEEEPEKVQSQPAKQNPSAEELFDALIQEEQDMETEMFGTTRSSGQKKGRPSPPRADLSPDTASSSTALSSEALERMERNRRLAMEKRARKLGIPVTPTPQHGSPASRPSTNEGTQEDISHPTSQPELAADAPASTDDDCQGTKETPEEDMQDTVEITEEHIQNSKKHTPDSQTTLEEHAQDPDEHAPDSQTTLEEHAQDPDEHAPDSQTTLEEHAQDPDEHAPDSMETSEEHATPDSGEAEEERTLEDPKEVSEELTLDLTETSGEHTTPHSKETPEEQTQPEATPEEHTPDSKETPEEYTLQEATPKEHTPPDTMETSEKHATLDSEETSEEHTAPDTMDTSDEQRDQTVEAAQD